MMRTPPHVQETQGGESPGFAQFMDKNYPSDPQFPAWFKHYLCLARAFNLKWSLLLLKHSSCASRMHVCFSLSLILCFQQCLISSCVPLCALPRIWHIVGAHELRAEMEWSRGDRGRGLSRSGPACHLVEHLQLFLLVSRVLNFIFVPELQISMALMDSLAAQKLGNWNIYGDSSELVNKGDKKKPTQSSPPMLYFFSRSLFALPLQQFGK